MHVTAWTLGASVWMPRASVQFIWQMPTLAARSVSAMCHLSLQCLCTGPALPIPVFLAVWIRRSGSAHSPWNDAITPCGVSVSHDRSLLPPGILGEWRACASACTVATSCPRRSVMSVVAPTLQHTISWRAGETTAIVCCLA